MNTRVPAFSRLPCTGPTAISISALALALITPPAQAENQGQLGVCRDIQNNQERAWC